MSKNTLPELKMYLPESATEMLKVAESLIESVQVKPINVHDEYEAISSDRNTVNDLIKLLEAERKALTKPIDELKQRVMTEFSVQTDKLAEIKTNCETEMLAFKRRLDEERARQQRDIEIKAQAEAKAERDRLAAIAAQKEAEGECHVAEAIIEEAAKITASVPVLAPVRIPSEKVLTKKLWKFRIVDVNKIPREFLIPNEKLLQSIATSSKESAKVEGVEFYFEETISAKKGAK